MILAVYKKQGDKKPFAVFGGGAFDFEYMNETLLVTTQRVTKQFDCKHLSVCQGYVAAYEEWESHDDLEGALKNDSE